MRLGAGRRSLQLDKRPATASATQLSSGRRLHLLRPAQKMTSGDQECMEVEPAPAQPFNRGGASSSAAANEDDDEDLQFVGRTGLRALSDFPHSRENCLESPWRPERGQVVSKLLLLRVRCARFAVPAVGYRPLHGDCTARRTGGVLTGEWKANGGAAPSCRGGLRVVCSTHLLLLFLHRSGPARAPSPLPRRPPRPRPRGLASRCLLPGS